MKTGFLLSQQAQLLAESAFQVFCFFFPFKMFMNSRQQLSGFSVLLHQFCTSHLQKNAISLNPHPGSHRIQIPVGLPDGICSMFFVCNIGRHHWNCLQTLRKSASTHLCYFLVSVQQLGLSGYWNFLSDTEVVQTLY